MKKVLFNASVLLLSLSLLMLYMHLAYSSDTAVPLGIQVDELDDGILEVEKYNWNGTLTDQITLLKEDMGETVITQFLLLSIEMKQTFASILLLILGLFLFVFISFVSKKLHISNNPLNIPSKIHSGLIILLLVVYIAVLTKVLLQYYDLIKETENLMNLL
ncbi:hypothetical protein GCM10011351_24930 [Paraliobacillus quinghaiensis]|uniref:Uncharacterized protein n=1 Tax=Paraliobacillus quinghaiensis TaxID=470815 RepID=A0A917TTQ4_9BACI|nr:hypothetical protein [Paraliobacillus quinghaiensis]GGM37752.1 hypothetical protein GCM10011351_24930 [Paraliobacillus quinghaiensis]